jgi:hypothetical protein
MTVPFLRLPEGCTLWVDLAPFQDVAGNWSDDPPIYSVTTAGTADFFPAGLNDWWEYVGGEGEMSGYLIKTANVYAGNFDLNRYLPEFPGPQPEEYTVLDQIRHFAREGNILYWDGANERHEGDIWSGYTFDPPIQWLHFPLELGQDWEGQSDFEMDEDQARVSYTAEVTAILDYHPEWRGQLSHSTPSWSEGRQDFPLVFPDCAEVTLSYEIEVYREGDWHPAQVATETALYCPGLGLVRSHAEGTDYSEGGPVEYVDDHYLIGWLVGQ